MAKEKLTKLPRNNVEHGKTAIKASSMPVLLREGRSQQVQANEQNIVGDGQRRDKTVSFH